MIAMTDEAIRKLSAEEFATRFKGYKVEFEMVGQLVTHKIHGTTSLNLTVDEVWVNCGPLAEHWAPVSGFRRIVELPSAEAILAARDPEFPHQCPRCGGPAYLGFNATDCKAGC